MIMTLFLPGTVLRSEGLWPWTSADGLETRRYSAGRSNAAPSSKATWSVRLSFANRISVGQRFASMIRSFRVLLHVVKLTRQAERLHYRPDPTHPLIGTIVPATAASDLAPLTPPTPLIDPFGRTVTYLRVSVTDRCDFRCFYCMSEDMTFLPKRDLLTLEELDRVCSVFIERGVRKLRLTGGEPLVRRNIMTLFTGLSRHLASGALDELTLTTNGSQLARFAGELAAHGVRRINVSLDTLDPEKFRRITRWGDLGKVMEGVDAAQRAGLHVKINAVALKDLNEDEIPLLLEWAHGRGMDMTLIEVMPLGEVETQRVDQFLPLSLVRARLAERYPPEGLDEGRGGAGA